MPSIVTHYLMGEVVATDINNSLTEIIMNNYQEFAIGTSGPDLFFYYNVYPWMNQKEAKRIAKIGSKIHQENINDFFKELLHHAKYSYNSKVISYTAGLLCHFVLDSIAHPFIYYFTQAPETNDSDYYHRNFESNIDGLLLKYTNRLNLKPYSIVAFDNDSIKAIFNVYAYPLKKVYNIEITEDIIDKCMHHFYSLQKLLYDPYAIKDFCTRKIETIFNVKSQALSMLIPTKYYEDNLDILNLKHETWYHPVTKEASNQSFIDLFLYSIKKAKELLEMFNQYLNDEIDIEDLLMIIQNKSYDTGMSYNAKMRFFDCKYLREKKCD